MRTYGSLNVANYIINKAIDKDKCLDNWTLQNILYFSYLEYFRREGKRLFSGGFIACNFGIGIYKVHKRYMPNVSWCDRQRTTIKKLSIDDYIDILLDMGIFDLCTREETPYAFHYKYHKEVTIPIKDIETHALSSAGCLKYRLFTFKYKIRTFEKLVINYANREDDKRRATINIGLVNFNIDALLYGNAPTEDDIGDKLKNIDLSSIFDNSIQ